MSWELRLWLPALPESLQQVDFSKVERRTDLYALGLGDVIGCFDVGKRFDAVVLTAELTPAIPSFEGGVAEDASDVLHKLLTLSAHQP